MEWIYGLNWETKYPQTISVDGGKSLWRFSTTHQLMVKLDNPKLKQMMEYLYDKKVRYNIVYLAHNLNIYSETFRNSPSNEYCLMIVGLFGWVMEGWETFQISEFYHHLPKDIRKMVFEYIYWNMVLVDRYVVDDNYLGRMNNLNMWKLIENKKQRLIPEVYFRANHSMGRGWPVIPSHLEIAERFGLCN